MDCQFFLLKICVISSSQISAQKIFFTHYKANFQIQKSRYYFYIAKQIKIKSLINSITKKCENEIRI